MGDPGLSFADRSDAPCAPVTDASLDAGSAADGPTPRARRIGSWRAGWAVVIVGLVVASVVILAGGSGPSPPSQRRPGALPRGLSPGASAQGSTPAQTSPTPPTGPQAVDAQASAPSPPAAAPPVLAAGKTEDGSFSLVAFSLDPSDPSGLFSAGATIRNNGPKRLDGVWEVRLYKGPNVVGTVQASGVPIDAGQAVSLQMQSNDHSVGGVDRYEFRTVATYAV